MRVGAFQFNTSWFVTLVTVALLGLLLWLGNWQLGRAGVKQLLLDADAGFATQTPVDVMKIPVQTQAPRQQRITATGQFMHQRQFLLDNRTRNGRAGYYVLTPLKLADGTALIVNRGWVPTGLDRTQLPDLRIAAVGVEVTVTGHVHHPAEEQLLLGPSGYDDQSWPRVVQRAELSSVATAIGRDVRPFTLRLDVAHADGYNRQWPVHYGITPERHRAYAFQWFSLAAALLTIYIVVNTRKVSSS